MSRHHTARALLTRLEKDRAAIERDIVHVKRMAEREDGRGRTRHSILELLADGTPRNTITIAAMIGVTRPNVAGAINRMLTANPPLLVRTARGVYGIPTPREELPR